MEDPAESESHSTEEALTRKLDEIFTDSDNEAGQFCFKEETIEKVMQELYKEIIASQPLPTKPPSPSHSPLVVEDVNDHDSVGLPVVISEEKKDEGDFDDEWLARVLSWGQGQLTTDSDWF